MNEGLTPVGLRYSGSWPIMRRVARESSRRAPISEKESFMKSTTAHALGRRFKGALAFTVSASLHDMSSVVVRMAAIFC
jgi:hypothetical protein